MTKFDMRKIREANDGWFSRKNKRYFGDVSYRALRGKTTGNVFLVRSTYAWSDMFGGPKMLSWRINTVRGDYTIGSLLDGTYRTIEAVKAYLKTA